MAGELARSEAGVTAVVAAADILAIGAMKGFYDAGLRVPEDMSIIGFDDLEISQYLAPGLTTVRQQISLKGQRAVELLLEAHRRPEPLKAGGDTAPQADRARLGQKLV